MYYEFGACRARYRVYPDGTVARIRGINQEKIAPTPSETAILRTLLRAEKPIPIDQLIACLPASGEGRGDSLTGIQKHVAGLHRRLRCPQLIRSRNQAYFLNASVRKVTEIPVASTQPVEGASDAAIKIPIRVPAAWMTLRARANALTVDLAEITATRADGEFRVIGYVSGPLHDGLMRRTMERSELSTSGLLEWGGDRGTGRHSRAHGERHRGNRVLRCTGGTAHDRRSVGRSRPVNVGRSGSGTSVAPKHAAPKRTGAVVGVRVRRWPLLHGGRNDNQGRAAWTFQAHPPAAETGRRSSVCFSTPGTRPSTRTTSGLPCGLGRMPRRCRLRQFARRSPRSGGLSPRRNYQERHAQRLLPARRHVVCPRVRRREPRHPAVEYHHFAMMVPSGLAIEGPDGNARLTMHEIVVAKRSRKETVVLGFAPALDARVVAGLLDIRVRALQANPALGRAASKEDSRLQRRYALDARLARRTGPSCLACFSPQDELETTETASGLVLSQSCAPPPKYSRRHRRDAAQSQRTKRPGCVGAGIEVESSRNS